MKAGRFAVGSALLMGTMLLAQPAIAQTDAAKGSERAPTTGAAAPAAPAAQAPTDPQIAEIVLVADQVDVDAAKLAKSHTKNKAVREFAETMIRDHSGVNKQAKALAHKLHVTPEPSATSKSLADGGKENVAALKKLKGAAFDKAYVDHEVAYHQAVADAVNNTLLPNTKNAELKALIVKAVPVFVAHLEHAKKMQAEMSGEAGAQE